jgi:ElaB/YqjD/DUF883 family membrane-anchored ribosome-binding protein
MQTAKEGADAVVEQARTGYEAAERLVHERPATSVAAAFGTGLVLGAIVTLFIHPQR